MKAYKKGQTPPPKIDVDEWADKYRFMTESKREKWFTDRMEVARGPMKAVTEPGVRTITAMCATQLLKTELILNTIGYFVDIDPCPLLVVQPKGEAAKKFSNVRLKEMINATPRLKKLFVEDSKKDSSNTQQHKEFKGGHIDIVTAGSPTDLAMLSIRVVLLDEIDKYDESSGEEGDPVDLAEERMSKYSTNSLSIRVCSPTTKDASRIEASYKSSDQRKPFVQCPHCDGWQTLKWKQVVYSKDAAGEPIPTSANYCCEHCGVAWSEYERLKVLQNTIQWRQTAEFTCDKCDHINKPDKWHPNDSHKWKLVHHCYRAVCEECNVGMCSNEHAGFWASKFYGQFRGLESVVRLWKDVKENIEKLKMFVNTQLAETFTEKGEKIEDVEFLTKRCERYDEGTIPTDKIGLLTAGIDTQNNRIEIEVVGWGLDEESWSIEHKVIPGDPALPSTWKLVDDFLRKKFYYPDGRYTYIAAASIDMGGGHTQDVANYCRHRINRRIWPIRGVGGDGKPYPVWPKNPSRGGKYDVPFYNVGVDAGKNVVFNRLFTEKEGPGYCHFTDQRPAEWFKQLIAEKRVKKYKGTRKILVWENKSKARNEAFDCRVYAYAALCGLQAMGWNLNNIVTNQKLILLSTPNSGNSNQEHTNPRPVQKVNKKPKSMKSNFMSK